MKTEIKTRWVEALRSGDYKQGKSFLATEDSGEMRYCCLGVLCELASQHGVVERDGGTSCDIEDCDLNHGGYRFKGEPVAGVNSTAASRTVLPAAVMEWAGLDDPNPSVTYKNGTPLKTALANLNDSGWQFTEIADLIEEGL